MWSNPCLWLVSGSMLLQANLQLEAISWEISLSADEIMAIAVNVEQEILFLGVEMLLHLEIWCHRQRFSILRIDVVHLVTKKRGDFQS